jgi:hypothetical protein
LCGFVFSFIQTQITKIKTLSNYFNLISDPEYIAEVAEINMLFKNHRTIFLTKSKYLS